LIIPRHTGLKNLCQALEELPCYEIIKIQLSALGVCRYPRNILSSINILLLVRGASTLGWFLVSRSSSRYVPYELEVQKHICIALQIETIRRACMTDKRSDILQYGSYHVRLSVSSSAPLHRKYLLNFTQ